MQQTLRKVAITGASSGIGAALARELAAQGASLALLARRGDKLRQLAAELGERHPGQTFFVQELDVAQTAQVLPALTAARDALGGLDTVIANAGVTSVNATGKGDFSREEHLLQINLLGGMATCDAAARLMREQGGGRIVGIASIAAFVGIPGSAAYSASKAGFGHYLETIRLELARKGIVVTAIYPGFINTELAPGMAKMPFVIDADRAARAMVSAIRAGKRRAIVPAWPWRLLLPFLGLVPERVLTSMLH